MINLLGKPRSAAVGQVEGLIWLVCWWREGGRLLKTFYLVSYVSYYFMPIVYLSLAQPLTQRLTVHPDASRRTHCWPEAELAESRANYTMVNDRLVSPRKQSKLGAPWGSTPLGTPPLPPPRHNALSSTTLYTVHTTPPHLVFSNTIFSQFI